ncbi:MAG TPA: DUF5667 domain-containing protein [Candidatus Acidoferrales bacterium]|nr:DUF5667 domain-containing protein [Candidatus Acidoferrales bacterium]
MIEQVARGERRLDSIKDTKLREAIRVALRIHENAPAEPDDYARLRMRARVLSRLEPRGPSLADNAWIALELLGRPAPLIVRGVALAALLAVAGMGATVVAADSLPDDLLYPLKVASEAVRLTLADVPDDRASVELSIAEHRLAEAEKLAVSGRTSDALVASAMYSQHVASAAAELVPNDSSTVAQQLESTFAQQRDRAQQLATTLSATTKSAAAAQILATIAKPSVAPGVTVAERVAVTAAGVAEDLEAVAEHDAAAATTQNAAASLVASSPTSATSPTPPRTVRTQQPAPTHQIAGRSSALSQAEKKASDVLKVVRRAADEARAAADKIKNHK